MELEYCAQCGLEIEGKGIQFRSRTFCADECCEEFEAEFIAKGEPGLDDLADDVLDDDELVGVGLGFQDDDDLPVKDEDDDSFSIDPDDF